MGGPETPAASLSRVRGWRLRPHRLPAASAEELQRRCETTLSIEYSDHCSDGLPSWAAFGLVATIVTPDVYPCSHRRRRRKQITQTRTRTQTQANPVPSGRSRAPTPSGAHAAAAAARLPCCHHSRGLAHQLPLRRQLPHCCWVAAFSQTHGLAPTGLLLADLLLLQLRPALVTRAPSWPERQGAAVGDG
jgi:hypothetical protein